MKIVFTGPESSGKTTLAEILCQKYPFTLVREFSREYMKKTGLNYDRQHVYEMGLLQLWEEKTTMKGHPLICCDTDLQNILLWQKVRYGSYDEHLLKMWLTSPGDHYFVCRPDIPWQPDSLRENPLDRGELFDMHLELLNTYKMPYTVIEGNLEQRIAFVESNPSLIHYRI